ncbi:glycoside hydrolase family 5 protein [Fistulina hepatica ATCC 64428]|uniref:glucan 1,3-beta-glucosidase n=1 Tax=Fistulina hepatica ATCC 64428 TaxID=1128425 RepID=A0A0D7AKB6_9AGAR|nr:glycoside hydrolase family 5 protein [Fistulina hepatica ATCC 64428]
MVTTQTPRDSSYTDKCEGDSAANLAPSSDNAASDKAANEKPSHVRRMAPRRRQRILLFMGIAAGVLVVLFLAIFLPIYFKIIKPSSNSSSSGNNGSSPYSPPGVAKSGYNGSTVTLANGSTFMYINNYGGYWAYDEDDPYGSASSGKANEWTPAVNETWTWGKDRIYGVNLGGLFVLEPFITPSYFQEYTNSSGDHPIDEWTLSELMAANGSLQSTLENHYDTFATEQDFAEMVGAGLNWVRLPIPYWAIPGSVWNDEPFLEGVCWKYIIRVLMWCRKYGLRVNLDLHTIPGSQNGYNHSGKYGSINFLHDVMGIANAQRALEYMRTITEWFAQSEYSNLVYIFGFINEPLLEVIGADALESFYTHTQEVLRNITGYGEGNGMYLSIHDGFIGVPSWTNSYSGVDRLILDTHPYFAFDNLPNDAPIATGTDPETAGGQWPLEACNSWGSEMNDSRSDFGVTIAGEFSTGYNDCGLFLRGVGSTTTYGGNCSFWEDATQWNASVKAGLMEFARAEMDALGDWFFWTWKVGESISGTVESPAWSYKLGLELGYIPTDPRTAVGKCARLNVTTDSFNGTFAAYATGALGNSSADYTLQSTASAYQYTWPPSAISDIGGSATTAPATDLPTYTATASQVTLAASAVFTVTETNDKVATYTVGGAGTGTQSFDGWYRTADTSSAPAAVSGCTYPDSWNATAIPLPGTTCGSAVTTTTSVYTTTSHAATAITVTA